MDTFSCTTQLNSKIVAGIMGKGLYKKPSIIFAQILGLYFISTIILDHYNIINWYSGTPYWEIGLGLFLLLAPILILFISIVQFNSNPANKEAILYTFSNQGVEIKGNSYLSKLDWIYFMKQKEIGQYLILYHSKKFGSYIDKTMLTDAQIEFIKFKINGNTKK